MNLLVAALQMYCFGSFRKKIGIIMLSVHKLSLFKNRTAICVALFFTVFSIQAFSQSSSEGVNGIENKTISFYKFSVSTTYLTIDQFSQPNCNMYEFHFGYRITPKDKFELKLCTWKLFEPMGIPIWDSHLMKESEFYPGKIQESGIGIAYQRILWKGLFVSIEVLPLMKNYLDENNKKIGDGFKLYTSYHLGYAIPLFKNRLYIEPQIHCNYWPIDTKGPQGFEDKEKKWGNNFFLFEPNLFIGINYNL